jgi:hypothetical protein
MPRTGKQGAIPYITLHPGKDSVDHVRTSPARPVPAEGIIHPSLRKGFTKALLRLCAGGSNILSFTDTNVVSNPRAAHRLGLSATSLSFCCLHPGRAGVGSGFSETPIIVNHDPAGAGCWGRRNHAFRRNTCMRTLQTGGPGVRTLNRTQTGPPHAHTSCEHTATAAVTGRGSTTRFSSPCCASDGIGHFLFGH